MDPIVNIPMDYNPEKDFNIPMDFNPEKDLEKLVAKGDWLGVCSMYEQSPEWFKVKINESGMTALHVAVYDGKEDIVAKLVSIITGADETEALTFKDERGNTPLHIAASIGNERMCRCIVGTKTERKSLLVGARNHDGETPFFLAALHGRKEVFRYFHSIMDNNEGYSYSRRNNGDTILHCAISEEHFDLAFGIASHYGNLTSIFNEHGFSPLNLLATKPSVFISSTHLGFFHRIIYQCEEFIFYRDWKDPLTPPEKNGEKISEIKSKERSEEEALYGKCFIRRLEFKKFVVKTMLGILGYVSSELKKIRDKEQNHIWAVTLVDELVSPEDLEKEVSERKQRKLEEVGERKQREVEEAGGRKLHDEETLKEIKSDSDQVGQGTTGFSFNIRDQVVRVLSSVQQNYGDQGNKRNYILNMETESTSLLIAAKNGITEIVKRILSVHPSSINDFNSYGKNVLLLAVENRQIKLFEFLLKEFGTKESMFRKVDNKGNSVLHLAAMLGERKPWVISGAALQMQWELKWYEFIKDSVASRFVNRYNNDGKTAEDVFTDTHKELVKAGGEWLTNTSQSCSVVATLIATVAFATSAIVPGGIKEDTGTPNLERQPIFTLFAASSLVALSFSVASVIMFLSLLTSRYEERDFRRNLPRKLLIALTFFLLSMVSMLISFSAGHFFVLRNKLRDTALLVYAVACLPVYYSLFQFPLYVDILRATFKKVPQRRH